MTKFLPPSMFTPLILLALDRFTKQWAWVRGQFVANPGWFFFNLPPIIFAPLSLMAVYFLSHQIILAYRARHRLTFTGLVLILSGGFSNLYDRLIFGFVVDWIKFPLWHISVFNLADVMIAVGLGLL